MGQLMVKLAEPLQQCTEGVKEILRSGRKRKRDSNSCSENENQQNSELQSPKKKKLLTTTQYIYQALFKEQKNSDIAVMAMGKVWNLHKVYLSQSPYFYSMFNGSWKESCQDFVHIKILDDRITLDALDSVFGSMYSDEIEIDPKDVISVLATATLFLLEGIIDKCAEVMVETINVETAIVYYEAACQYGCANVKKSAFEWLEINLLCIYMKNQKILRHVSRELMTALISSPDLYVMQTEFSLYTLLRTWMYIRLHPHYDPDDSQQFAEESGCSSSEAIHLFFADRSEKRSFLTTPDGQQFLKPFQALRTQYLTNHQMDLKIVLNENIIPKEWLHHHVLGHWNAILKMDHLPDEGPQNLDADIFYKNCMRCGRILLESGYQKWRWTGFNFGLDLILIADSRVLSVRRHHRNEHERLLSLQTKRQFMIRACITSINAQRQPIFTQKSEITSLSLEKNEEVTLMIMDTKLVHPLLISVNLLVVPPVDQSFKSNTLPTEESTNAIPISEIGANCERGTTTPLNDAPAVCLMPASPICTAIVPTTSHRSPSASSSASRASSMASTLTSSTSSTSSAASSADFL